MPHERTTAWDMLSMVLWSCLFAIGLVPDLAFQMLRSIGNVSSYEAFVNNSAFITFALAAYLAYFVMQRCIEAGAPPGAARGKALTAGCMALAAFLELPARGTSPFEPVTFLQVLIQFREIDDAYVRNVVLIVGFGKLFCWWVLFASMLRYHAFGNRRVFLMLPALLPSAKPPPPPRPEKDEASHDEHARTKVHESPAPK